MYIVIKIIDVSGTRFQLSGIRLSLLVTDSVNFGISGIEKTGYIVIWCFITIYWNASCR